MSVMQIQENKLSESILEIVFDLDSADIENDLQKAARRLSEGISIPGFRPGLAPYDVVCRQVGSEAKVYEEAMDGIIRRTLPALLDEKKLETFGAPEISVQKMVPPFGVSYKALISLLPRVELGDISKIKVERKVVKTEPDEVNKVIEELRQMRVSEAAVSRSLQKGDKAILDFEIKRDGVVIEGGKAVDYSLVIGEGRFIPGFEDNLIGAAVGESKTFTLNFPENFYDKNLAGKPAEFMVKIKQIFERILPEANDEFAQTVGNVKTANELREQIGANLQKEKEQDEQERFELACMEDLLRLSKMGELPERAIKEETEKMTHELEHTLADRGVKFEDYLSNIKKSRVDLEKEFKPRAEHRLRIGLVARAFGRQENIVVGEDEIDKEIALSKKIYQQNPEMLKQFASPEYRDYVRNILTSRKIFANLAEKVRDK